MSGDKTEEPTEKKLDDARKQGNVWKSKDLSGLVSLVVALGVVKSTWGTIDGEIRKLFFFATDAIAHPETLEVATLQSMLMLVTTTLLLSTPVAFAAALGGSLSDFLQVGSLFSVEVLVPKPEKLNPVEGFKNLFSKKQLIEAVKNLIKLGVTGYVVFGVVRDSMGMVGGSIRGDAALTLLVLGEITTQVVQKVVLLFVVFAIFDVWYQRYQYMEDQKMSKDDVKKEYKESEGDPHHKAHRKEFHREIMEGAQMEAVKGADVIVTNPDHLAIALRYVEARDAAPRVIAKGADALARRMKAVAREAQVPLVRNVPLAHALNRLQEGEEIPEALYDAVAEVLRFVWQLDAKAAARARALPDVPVATEARAHG